MYFSFPRANGESFQMLAPAVSSYLVEAYDEANNLVYCEGIFPDTVGSGVLLGW